MKSRHYRSVLAQRVVEVCHKYKLIKGDSFDLRTGFDLSDPAVPRKVGRRIIETNAVLIILSLPCTKFSTLQALNLHSNGPECAAVFAVEKEKAIAHIEYLMKLAKLRISRGAYFLFEHPAHATSWELPCIKESMKMTGVEAVVGDMCICMVSPSLAKTGRQWCQPRSRRNLWATDTSL